MTNIQEIIRNVKGRVVKSTELRALVRYFRNHIGRWYTQSSTLGLVAILGSNAQDRGPALTNPMAVTNEWVATQGFLSLTGATLLTGSAEARQAVIDGTIRGSGGVSND